MLKRLIISLSVIGAVFFSGLSSYAQSSIGYVDISEVLKNYPKAQKLAENFKLQQNELKQMIVDAREQLKAAENEEDKKKMEQKLSKELQDKNDSMKEQYSKEIESVQTDISKAIEKVADKEKVDAVINKSEILAGGVDLTEKVLKILNK